MAGTSVSERWRPIPSTKGMYEASDMGRVRRSPTSRMTGNQYAPGRVMAPRREKNGYLRMGLHIDVRKIAWRSVHRLVAEAFIGPPPVGMQVNHIDGDKTNNRPENLEYVTAAQNAAHASRIGLCPSGDRNGMRKHPERAKRSLGEAHGMSKLTAEQVTDIRAVYAAGGRTQASVGRQFGVCNSAVSLIVNRKLWDHV